MSYSFVTHAATKAELKSKIADQLAAVVLAQPAHKVDQDAAQTASNAFIDVLANDDARDFQAEVSGWLESVNGDQVQRANLTVNTSLIARK